MNPGTSAWRVPSEPYTVKRELGHGDLRLVEEVYGHLGQIRHRSDEGRVFLLCRQGNGDYGGN